MPARTSNSPRGLSMLRIRKSPALSSSGKPATHLSLPSIKRDWRPASSPRRHSNHRQRPRRSISARHLLTVRAVQRVLTSVEVMPERRHRFRQPAHNSSTPEAWINSASEIAGLTFTWESSATNVATIDQNGLANGPCRGTINDQSHYAKTSSGTALLNVTTPNAGGERGAWQIRPRATRATPITMVLRDGAQDEFVELVNATQCPR